MCVVFVLKSTKGSLDLGEDDKESVLKRLDDAYACILEIKR